MSRRLAIWAVAAAAAALAPPWPAPAALGQAPAPETIMARARASLGDRTFFLRGKILSGERIGKSEHIARIEVLLDFTAEPFVARYTLCDAFGEPVEQMTLCASAGEDPEVDYSSGSPLRPAAAPSLSATLRGTDLAWDDLALLFLMQGEERSARLDNIRGRDCYALEFQMPHAETVLVWLDSQMLVPVQIERFDREGVLKKRISVKKVKKFGEQWMVRSLEIKSYPSLHRTFIAIDEASSVSM